LICVLLIQNETSSSKSLLQELTQRRYCSIPTYKSTRTGPPHMPTFFSTVEVEGVEFHGKASSSKKEAEYDAAKIAYKALKDGKFIHLILLSCIRIALMENFDII